MANPRRTSSQFQSQNPPILPISQSEQLQQHHHLHQLSQFLKKPHAFPFLLSIFVLLTWISLRFQSQSSNLVPNGSGSSVLRSGGDLGANLVRFSGVEVEEGGIMKDGRGWLVDPVVKAKEAGIIGGAQSCASIHVGEIRPGSIRGNHRHHTCNETFVIWGAETKFRLENAKVEGKGYAEVIIGADEVAIAVSPAGTAHALINTDKKRTTFFLGCQDSVINYNSSTTDFIVWKDL